MKSEPVYYYIRGNQKTIKKGKEYVNHPPAITVCIAESDVEGFYLRGIAICSAKDHPEKSLIPMDSFGARVYEELYEDDKGIAECNIHGGRDWALRRVKRAERFLKKCNSEVFVDPINTDNQHIIDTMTRFGLASIPFGYKTYAIPINGLTDFEKKLFIKVQ
jgi:hypothetical protein